jgi:hypothetical protein
MRTVSKFVLIGSFLALGMTGVYAQQAGDKAPSTVDPAAQQKGAQQAPKTTGAMDNAVGNLATSPDDVKRQTEGKPTAAQEGKGAGGTTPKPEVTQNAPGTVGAAPGNDPASGNQKK